MTSHANPHLRTPMLTHCLGVVQAVCCLSLKGEADPEAPTGRGYQLAELLVTSLILKGNLSGGPSWLPHDNNY